MFEFNAVQNCCEWYAARGLLTSRCEIKAAALLQMT